MVARSTIYHQPAHLLQGRRLLVHRYMIGAPLVRTRWCDPPLSVIRCLVHCPLLEHRHQDLDVKVGPRRRVVLVSQEFFDLCTRRDASLDGRANGLFSCRRCSLSRGQVDAWGRPHGEGSWADEFFHGECLQGTTVEGELLGKFQSRETGRMRNSSSCIWIVSGPRVLRHFGRSRESRGSSDAWNPQNFLATPAHGLGGPSRGSGFRRHALRHISAERASRRRASSFTVGLQSRWLYPMVLHALPGRP